MLTEPTLDEARQALDQTLVEALTASIAHRSSSPEPTPDADALMLRDLLDRTADHRQRRILKALHGRMAALNGPAILSCGPQAGVLVGDRYGRARSVETSDAALAEAGRGVRAVIDIASSRPWWGRLLARPDLRVVGALEDDRNGLPRALMISTETSGPTGDDRSFWVTDSSLPDADIGQVLAALGLAGHLLAQTGGLKLFLLAGYVQAEDGRLEQTPGSLKGVIGAAPVF